MTNVIGEFNAIYDRYFQVVEADTPSSLCEAFRLRHQVYCVEKNFEGAGNKELLECDEFDSHSVHSIIIDRATDTVIGTVRLILPYSAAQQVALPVQRLCRDLSDEDHRLFFAGRAAEISRFAISKEFRRGAATMLKEINGSRGSTSFSRFTGWCEQSFVALGLLRAVFQMSLDQGVTHLYAVMEPALLRLISRVGLEFGTIGPTVDYHGTRQPSRGEIRHLLTQLRRTRPDIWRFIKSVETGKRADTSWHDSRMLRTA